MKFTSVVTERNFCIAENNYEERTMEPYLNRIAPRLKTFKKLEANLKGFGSFNPTFLKKWLVIKSFVHSQETL